MNSNEQQNWRQLASVQVGGAICLPLLLVGYELAKQGHPVSMLFSILWGNLLLFGLALIAGFMSTKRNLTTVEHASFYFGRNGRKFFALTLSTSMLGWFAIQTQCMGTDVYHLLQHLQVNLNWHTEIWQISISLVLAALMIVGAFWGLQFLTWMSNMCIPMLVATIGYAIFKVGIFSWENSTLQSFPLTLWDGKGVSLVLASSMAATVDLPTFYRHADGLGATIKASLANYLIAMPLVQMAGMWLYYGTQAPTISEALAIQSSLVWKIWSVCFMLLAGWTTNNVNLYSAALSLRSLFKNMTFSSAMGFAGLLGCCLVFIPVLDQFALVLDLIGIFVVAMGGAMFMAYLIESYFFVIKPIYMWMAWSFGIATGLGAFMWPQWGSGAPVLDAGLVAMVILPCLLILDVLLKPVSQAFKEEIG
jgi:cytosine permease